MGPVVVALAGMASGIIIVAIITHGIVSSLRLRRAAESSDLEQRVERLEAENRALRGRVESVEIIVTDGEWTPTEDAATDLPSIHEPIIPGPADARAAVRQRVEATRSPQG